MKTPSERVAVRTLGWPRRLGPLALGSALVACSAAEGAEGVDPEGDAFEELGGEYPAEAEGEGIGEATAPILNGSTITADGSGVLRLTGLRECTGTLLKNQWALTAASCMGLEYDDTFAAGTFGVVAATAGETAYTYAAGLDNTLGTWVGGMILLPMPNEFVAFIKRFTATGAVDTTFGVGGMVKLQIGTMVSERIRDFAFQKDGKVIAVGEGGHGANGFAARFTASGALDSTYGSGGVVLLLPPDGTKPRMLSVVLDSSGRAVVAGGENGRIALARLTTLGAPDPSFSSDGFAVSTHASLAGLLAHDVVIDSSGRILVAGQGIQTVATTLPRGLVARFTSSGDVDPAFDAVLEPATAGAATGAEAVRVQGTNLIVAGYDGTQAVVWRRTSTGAADLSFGVQGSARPKFSGQQSTRANALAFAPDGRIRVAGTGFTPSSTLIFATLSANGALTAHRKYTSTHGLVLDRVNGGLEAGAMAVTGDRVVLAAFPGSVVALRPDRTQSTTLTNRFAAMGSATRGVDQAFIPTTADDVAVVRLAAPMAMNGSTSGYMFPGFVTDVSALPGTSVTCKGYGESIVGGAGGTTLRQGTSLVSTVGSRFATLVPLAAPATAQLPLDLDIGGACTTSGRLIGVHSYGTGTKAVEVLSRRFSAWALGVIGP